ncbi:sugar kinase [Microcoleus sp. FACHB-831]|uniref:sugar kinase n=1 Tax=Microcoleus sp. FACHB-831 TaxID=2692827 RepID=UPI001686EE61|nr:sugar kinase [Microcoleus sp. FACHB-831]MBD1922749.1 sugar kinase [Microcoleus sp. FACHB-831]
MKQGFFVGLVTLDLVYLTAGLPDKNQKIVASDYAVSAGGPATNAAVAFSYLNNRATVLGSIGVHPINSLIKADLESHHVTVLDLAPDRSEPPPTSSIIITQATGDRAVISINAVKSQVAAEKLPSLTPLSDSTRLEGVDIVLIDGHQIAVGEAIAQTASSKNIPVVLDGGSWKPGLEKILPFVDYAICSANYYPPGCHSSEEVFSYLSSMGIPYIAITRGEHPIQYIAAGKSGIIEIPKIKPVDTLGAGDIFHGAFCHYILQATFIDALAAGAKIASQSCQFFGTRRWMTERD